MISKIIPLLVTLLVAAIIGWYSAIYFSTRPNDMAIYKIGYWQSTSPSFIDAENPYILAQHANGKKLSIQSNEELVFKTDRDSDGKLLDSRCCYRIDNLKQYGNFFTLYTEDSFGNNAQQIDPKSPFPWEITSQLMLTKFGSKNSLNVMLSSATHPQGGNWLTSPQSGNYKIVISYYNSTYNRLHPIMLTLPTIHRISCN